MAGERTLTEELTELKAWLDSHWDPAMTVRRWWGLLAEAGWSAPSWPREWYGRGMTHAEAARIHRSIAAHGALGPPVGLGLLLAGPTLTEHGSEDQKQQHLFDIAAGRVNWCQLFSEPGAGSDLAGVHTRAEADGDTFVISGQKVWASSAHVSEYGMLLARTDFSAPKHRGLSYFIIDMRHPGVEVRPLRELTGRAMFNEVFLTDVVVPHTALVGAVGEGWSVATTTLVFERAGLGGGGDATPSAVPGTIANHLDRPAGDFVRSTRRRRPSVATAMTAEFLIDLAKRLDRADDPLVRDGLAALYTEEEVSRLLSVRQRALRQSGREVPAFANLAKLRMSAQFRRAASLGLSVTGARGMLHDYAKTSSSPVDAVAALALWAPAPAIYGGTDQVQRNIIGERGLGLPKEPADDRTVPFSSLPKNA